MLLLVVGVHVFVFDMNNIVNLVFVLCEIGISQVDTEVPNAASVLRKPEPQPLNIV